MSRETWEMGEEEFWEQFRYDPDYDDPTHNYPLTRQTATIVANESIDLEHQPF